MYYHLADALVELNRTAEAVPLFEKIPQEFEKSDYIEKAQKRLEEVKNAAATALTAPVKPKPSKEASPTETPSKETRRKRRPPAQTPPKQTPPTS